MSASKQTTIWCDHEGCVAFVQVDTEKTSDARRYILRTGWSPATHGGLISHGLDLCPQHQETA